MLLKNTVHESTFSSVPSCLLPDCISGTFRVHITPDDTSITATVLLLPNYKDLKASDGDAVDLRMTRFLAFVTRMECRTVVAFLLQADPESDDFAEHLS